MNHDIHNTILSVYDAASDDTIWPEVLQRFAEQIGALGCIVFEWQGLGNERRLTAPIASNFYDIDAIGTYIDRCIDSETRDQDAFEASSLASDNIDLIEDDVIAPSLDELLIRPNVVVLQKLGILHRAAGLLNKDNTSISRFSVQLSKHRGRLSGEERALMSGVLPHIAKALDLGRPAKQLALEHKGLIEAMNKLSIGVCLLDERGKVVSKNHEFERQLETHNAFYERPGGTLRLSNSKDQKVFSELLDHALNHGRFGARPRKEAVSASEASFLCVEVMPLETSKEIGSNSFGGFIVYSTDTSRPLKCNTLPIKYAYGLTDAELALVEGIAAGLTNSQIAERRNRSVATINAQVKSILSKSHCSTRTQFVRLMLSFGANYISDGSPL